MKNLKKFKCKNEEIVVICDYVQNCLQRDLDFFSKFAPKFNADFIADLKAKNEAINKIVFPHDKTKELKIVTARLYQNMDKLIDALIRLEAYIKLAKKAVPMSANDFGITLLKKKIRTKDAEGILKSLQMVNANVEKYRLLLEEQGLNTDIINQLNVAFQQIDSDNQLQYEIVSARRILSAENMNMLNAIYEQLIEICNIGKILFRKSQPEKLPDYTVSSLIKYVRIERKKNPVNT
jgi:hypothetical protein